MLAHGCLSCQSAAIGSDSVAEALLSGPASYGLAVICSNSSFH